MFAAIYINSASLLGGRGCIHANFSYPGGDEDSISYEIVKILDGNKFNITVCESIPDGSIESSCDNLTIKFKNREYITPNESKSVLSVEKIGE